MADPLTKQPDGTWLNPRFDLEASQPPSPGDFITPVGTYTSDTYSDTYS